MRFPGHYSGHTAKARVLFHGRELGSALGTKKKGTLYKKRRL
jgi:hypothetical protein